MEQLSFLFTDGRFFSCVSTILVSFFIIFLCFLFDFVDPEITGKPMGKDVARPTWPGHCQRLRSSAG